MVDAARQSPVEADSVWKGKEVKEKVWSRLGERGRRQGGVKRIEADEFRRLGVRCRCGAFHGEDRCTVAFQDMMCTYPPCTDKVGHNVMACYEPMKRCRMEVCQDQRGHRTQSHFSPGGREWYGVGASAAKELRLAFERYRPNLTQEEEDIIARYEASNKVSSRGNRWDRPY